MLRLLLELLVGQGLANVLGLISCGVVGGGSLGLQVLALARMATMVIHNNLLSWWHRPAWLGLVRFGLDWIGLEAIGDDWLYLLT